MQSITPVTAAQLRAAGQESLMKFEAYISDAWVNLCDIPVKTEKLTDGGLESWSDENHLTYWDEGAPELPGGMGIYKEASEVHDGSYSARMYTTAGGDWCWFAQDFTLTPGNKAKVILWYIRAAAAGTNLRLYLKDTGENVSLKSDGTWQAGVLPIYMSASAIWKIFQLEFTAHASYSNYRIHIYKGHSSGGASSFYVDDVSILEWKGNGNGGAGAGVVGGDYLESVSISLGGAGKTPNPVAGSWDASLLNENGIFHRHHPDSVYKDWCKTGRKIRISVGAKYGAVDYYWQRLIGFMDVPKFNTPDNKVAISGGDYMKRLQDMELRDLDNYWGASATFNSIASDGLVGSELYAEGDAMEIGGGEADNVTNWTPTNCLFVSLADEGGGSSYVGKATGQGPSPCNIKNTDVGSATAGKTYQVKFKHRQVGGTGLVGIFARIWQASGRCVSMLYFPTDDWKEETFYFTAKDTGAIQWWFKFAPVACDLRLDQFSVKEFTPYWKRYYELPEAAKGPYYVTLDSGTGPVPVMQGEKDEGWYYAEDAEPGPDPPAHPARIVFFDHNKVVPNGNDNLVIYYFTVQSPENVVADILVKAGYYVDQAAALAAMEYDATGVTIDKVWFKPGSKGLNAIKILCERCNYRFHFKWDGIPVFKPKPKPLSRCDVTTDWAGTSLSIDTEDKKEGIGSLKDSVAAPIVDSYYGTDYNPVGSWDFSDKKNIFFWLKSDRDNTAFTCAVLKIADTSANYRWWNLTFSAGEWTAINKLLSTGDGETETPPDLALINSIQVFFQAADTTPFYKKIDNFRVIDFTFTDPKQIASVNTYQDRNEIKNRIVIKGMKQAEPVNKEETMPSELHGEAHDQDSIDEYGERTMTINNHLFQTQAAIDAMKATLLAEYKDPKWYSDIEMEFNPVPLELGDEMVWDERLSPILDITEVGMIRDIKINNFNTTYVCEL